MKFTPKSREQIMEDSLLAEGNYNFKVLSAEAKPKENGEEQISLRLKIDMGVSNPRYMFDTLKESRLMKLLNFCEMTGLMDKYNSGDLTPKDCEGKTGIAHIKKLPANNGYDPSNYVKDYVVGEIKSSKTNPLEVEDGFKDSDLPF